METIKGYIYALVCPIKKEIVYVGQTRKKLKTRLVGHISETRRAVFNNRHLSKKNEWIKSLLDINIENEIEIILLKECYEKELNENEINYIKEYSKIYDLVNTSVGGTFGLYGVCAIWTDKRKKEMSAIKKNFYTIEQRNRFSIIMKEYYKKNPIPKKPKKPKIKKERQPHSEETKRKIGEKNKGEKNGMYGTHIKKSKEQIEKNRYNMINSEKFQKSRKSEEYRKKISDIVSIPIYLLDLDFNILKEFKNTTVCAEYLNCGRANVKNAIRHLRKVCKIYWVVRKENYVDNISKLRNKNIQ